MIRRIVLMFFAVFFLFSACACVQNQTNTDEPVYTITLPSEDTPDDEDDGPIITEFAPENYVIPADLVIDESSPACVANGWDSDTSEITVVSAADVNAKSVAYLKKGLSNYTSVNSDVKGWMYICGPQSIRGLPVSAPIMQCSNNEFYLDHDWRGNYDSSGGSIYAACQCDMTKLTANYNTVFYGHAKSMKVFGGLIYLDNAVRWYSDANNHFIMINTENEKTVWQIFSWYTIEHSGNYRKTVFSGGSEFVKYAETLQSRNEISAFKQFKFSSSDRIITFSTCKGTQRVAVHAVLVRSTGY